MERQEEIKMPTFDQLMNPLITALRELGGSATIDEMYERVVEILDLPDYILDIPHNEKGGNQSEVAYRLGWSRTYLKKYGVLENSARGVWALREDFGHLDGVDEKEVVRLIRGQLVDKPSPENDQRGIDEPEEAADWRDKLNSVLLSMEPSAFERLAQRLLRESGFTQVEVSGRSGDGGIDGKGIIRLNGILSFHTIFQCKRYQGSVSASHMRDFRGAMQGRADKGLFITTGTFTRDAIKEATRDGAPPIDLINGEQLMDMLRDLELGVKEVIKKDYEVDTAWFEKI